MICGPLQAMSLQIPITEVKQATFPLQFTKGKGRRKGQGTCRDPSCMSSASAERGSLTFPESLLPSYRAETPRPGKAGREGLRKTMDPVGESLPPNQPECPSSLTHSVQPWCSFCPYISHSPICQLWSSLHTVLPTCRPQRGRGGLRDSLGSELSTPVARDFSTAFLRNRWTGGTQSQCSEEPYDESMNQPD